MQGLWTESAQFLHEVQGAGLAPYGITQRSLVINEMEPKASSEVVHRHEPSCQGRDFRVRNFTSRAGDNQHERMEHGRDKTSPVQAISKTHDSRYVPEPGMLEKKQDAKQATGDRFTVILHRTSNLNKNKRVAPAQPSRKK